MGLANGAGLSLALLWGCHSGGEPPPVPPSALAAAAPASFPGSRHVDFRHLQPFLPAALHGYARGGDEASTGKYGDVLLSSAERRYVGAGGAELHVRIVDTSMVQTLGPAIEATSRAAVANGNTELLSALNGNFGVGYVRYEADGARAEANLLVGKRYIVAVTSSGIQGTADVRHVAQQLDLAGLAELR